MTNPFANTHAVTHHPQNYPGTTMCRAGTVSYVPQTVLKKPSVPEGKREDGQCPGVCHHLLSAPRWCSRLSNSAQTLDGTHMHLQQGHSQSVHSPLQNTVDKEQSAHKLELLLI